MKLASYKVWGNPHATFFDRFISIVTFGKFSHNELVFSDGVCFSISPRETLARFKRINLDESRWEIIELPNLNETAVRHKTEDCLGMDYDYKGAITSPFKLCIEDKRKGFCSEVCGDILRECGYDLERGCSYTPTRLHKEIVKLIKGKTK